MKKTKKYWLKNWSIPPSLMDEIKKSNKKNNSKEGI